MQKSENRSHLPAQAQQTGDRRQESGARSQTFSVCALSSVFCVLFFLVSLTGCSQKKIVYSPEQPPAQTQTEVKTKDSKTKADMPLTKEMPKESVDLHKESLTERHLTKAMPEDAKPDIKPDIKELQVKIRDIYFDFDKYDIREDAKSVLKEVSAILLKNKNIKVIIEGHTDERGTNEYNLGLGDRRANSAREYLVSLGIPSIKIETISYGEEKPLCIEQTEECWTKNRRAHFVLVEGGK